METKVCQSCKAEKTVDNFFRGGSFIKKNGERNIYYSKLCKECKPIKIKSQKFCPTCETIKPISEFYKHKSKPDGVQAYCKPCYKNMMNQKRKIDSVFREKRSKENKRYKIENREKINDYANKYYTERAKVDKLFNLKTRIRALVYRTFKINGYKKGTKTEKIIGCSYLEFRGHIEAQFESGMTWDNQGDWDLDHIIPLSSAENETEMMALSHYKNIQPLWEKENATKSNNYDINEKKAYLKMVLF